MEAQCCVLKFIASAAALLNCSELYCATSLCPMQEIGSCVMQHIAIGVCCVRKYNAVCHSILPCVTAYCHMLQHYSHLQLLYVGAQCCVRKYRPQADAWEPPGRSTNHLMAQDTHLFAEIMNKFISILMKFPQKRFVLEIKNSNNLYLKECHSNFWTILP